MPIVGTGCAYVPPGVIEGSGSSLGTIVVLQRQFPVYAEGLRDCSLHVVRAQASEFEHANAPHLLIQMTLGNGNSRAVVSEELDIRGYNLAGAEVVQRVLPQPTLIHAGRLALASWSVRLSRPSEIVRAAAMLTRVTYSDGSMCGYREAGPDRVFGSPEEPPPPRREPTPQVQHDAALVAVQAKLNSLGFDCGSPDGLLGERTRACIRRFQGHRGLDVTGKPDAATRAALDAATLPTQAPPVLNGAPGPSGEKQEIW